VQLAFEAKFKDFSACKLTYLDENKQSASRKCTSLSRNEAVRWSQIAMGRIRSLMVQLPKVIIHQLNGSNYGKRRSTSKEEKSTTGLKREEVWQSL
jgi:hypothetical protein